jgi:hypothetical protein
MLRVRDFPTFLSLEYKTPILLSTTIMKNNLYGQCTKCYNPPPSLKINKDQKKPNKIRALLMISPTNNK